jgi:hypothetical protein
MLGKIYKMMPLKTNLGQILVKRFIDRPVFVVGCGRSGTTALVKALGQHPWILSQEYEAPLYEHIGTIAYRYSQGEKMDYIRSTVQLPSDSLRDKLRRLCFEVAWGESWGLRSNFHSMRRSPKGFLSRRFWLIKAFPPEKEALGLLWLFPQAKFLYIYRNGIDVLASMLRHSSFKPLGFEALCSFWADRVVQYRYLTEWDRALTLRQEDFLNSPDEELRKIYDFLEIAPDSGPVDYAKSTLEHPLGQATQKVNPKRVINQRQPAHQDWSEEQKTTFRSICGDAMEELGYTIPF